MEGLLPVLIVVGISIAVSLLKKKPVTPTESDSLPQDSPWDDLLKEIQRQQSAPEREPEYHPEEYATEAQSLETIPEQSDVRPSFMPSEELAPMWQREEIVPDAEEHIPFDYEEDAIALSAPEAEGATNRTLSKGDIRAATDSRIENKIADADALRADNSADSGIFAKGFDPRMAVLYAEILRPKYQEY